VLGKFDYSEKLLSDFQDFVSSLFSPSGNYVAFVFYLYLCVFMVICCEWW
jgi:hypothetical protein